jgi:hypothetical protein
MNSPRLIEDIQTDCAHRGCSLRSTFDVQELSYTFGHFRVDREDEDSTLKLALPTVEIIDTWVGWIHR